MATRTPLIDRFSPILQELRDAFEEEYLPQGEPAGRLSGGLDGGLEAIRCEVAAAYFAEAKRPYVNALITDILSGRWGLGDTQEDVAQGLMTKDRAWLSDAKNKGELSFDMFARVRLSPNCPVDWEPSLRAHNAEIYSSGFIGVAKFLASFVTNRGNFAPESFNRFDYEIMCEIFRHFKSWSLDRFAGDSSTSARIVAHVVKHRQWDAEYDRSSKRERDEMLAHMSTLSESPDKAHQYLNLLADNWLDIFVAADTVCESLYGDF